MQVPKDIVQGFLTLTLLSGVLVVYQGVPAVKYEWLEKCLHQGRRVPEQPFLLRHVSTPHQKSGSIPGRGREDDASGAGEGGAHDDGGGAVQGEWMQGAEARAEVAEATSDLGARVLSVEEQEFWWREIFELAHWGLREKEREVLARKGAHEEWWRGLIKRPAQRETDSSARDGTQPGRSSLSGAQQAEGQRMQGSGSDRASERGRVRAREQGVEAGLNRGDRVSAEAEKRRGEENVNKSTSESSSVTGDPGCTQGRAQKRRAVSVSLEAGPAQVGLERVQELETKCQGERHSEAEPYEDETVEPDEDGTDGDSIDIFFGPPRAGAASKEQRQREHRSSLVTQRSGGLEAEGTSKLSSRRGGVTSGKVGLTAGIPALEKRQGTGQAQGLYDPPDLNRNLTEPFMELRNLYKDGLGEDYRALSYYKAVSVLEKVPIRITCEEHIKGLPSIGSSLKSQVRALVFSRSESSYSRVLRSARGPHLFHLSAEQREAGASCPLTRQLGIARDVQFSFLRPVDRTTQYPRLTCSILISRCPSP